MGRRRAILNWLTAAIFLLLPAIAWVARRSGGSWYAPAAFFAAFWCVFAGLPLVAGPIEVAPAGMLFLAAACAAVFAGAWLAHKRPVLADPQLEVREPPLLGSLIAACPVLGFVVLGVVLYGVETTGRAGRVLSV